MIKRFLRKWFIDFLAHKVFNTITVEDIISKNDLGEPMYRGQKLTKEQVKALKNDADLFVQSDIYTFMKNEVKHKGNIAIYQDSKTVDDIVAGKLLLYLNDIYESTLKRIRDL